LAGVVDESATGSANFLLTIRFFAERL